MIWHSSEIEDVLKELSVDGKKGLANGIADNRIASYGKNIIGNIEPVSFKKIFFKELKSGLVITLALIAFIAFGISLIYNERDFYSPLLIIAIVLLNAVISSYHLYSGEKVLNSLKSISNPDATVLRDGIEKNIPSDELVPGDIIILGEGDYITADARIIDSTEFRCNESVFTGENIPVEKKANILVEDIAPIDKRTNMVYAGTSVVHGSATAVVVATGLDTEIGHTSAIMQQTGEEKLPLQSVLKDSSKIINIAIITVCALVFIISLIQNFNSDSFASMTVKMLINAVSLAVAAIPEGLPAIATIVIGVGIERIIKNNILIKKTGALEILGKTSVLCADKTGLLTKNKMVLEKIYDGKQLIALSEEAPTDSASLLIKLATVCSTLNNDPTENAIEKACIDYNSMSKIDTENIYPRLAEIPFDSERKTMTTINMINERPFAISKGAPEILVPKCKNCNKEEILRLNEEMAADALRIVCIAIKPLDEIPANPNSEEIERDMTFAGLIGLIDPPHSDAYEAVESCDKAGIKTVMITGDNPTTARAIARRIGILKDGTLVLSGSELAEMSDEELFENIEKYSVYARVSPNDKLRIVKAWQAKNKTVTITGDSVADSEALSIADIGCAMGKSGTDIAKGSADIIAVNDRFLSIVAAIKESRGLFANIRKSVIYLLSCNFAEVLFYILGLLFFGCPPLAAVQLLWINLLTDCAPAISLSMEKAEDGVMRHKPIALKGHLFDRKTVISIVSQALFMTAVALISFLIGNLTSSSAAMTMTFLTVGIMQIAHAYNIKTDWTVFKADFKSNSFMNISVILTAFILLFLCVTPAGYVFGLTALSFGQLVISIALAITVVPFCEILKLLIKKI